MTGAARSGGLLIRVSGKPKIKACAMFAREPLIKCLRIGFGALKTGHLFCSIGLNQRFLRGSLIKYCWFLRINYLVLDEVFYEAADVGFGGWI